MIYNFTRKRRKTKPSWIKSEKLPLPKMDKSSYGTGKAKTYCLKRKREKMERDYLSKKAQR